MNGSYSGELEITHDKSQDQLYLQDMKNLELQESYSDVITNNDVVDILETVRDSPLITNSNTFYFNGKGPFSNLMELLVYINRLD